MQGSRLPRGGLPLTPLNELEGTVYMDNKPTIKMYAFTIDCQDPAALAAFYTRLLGWELFFSNEEWACIGPAGVEQGAYPGITFQQNPAYLPPVWPEEPAAQQQMAHLDFAVDDLESAVEYALRCGATEAAEQFSDGWRVMFDPAGHPFCLCAMKPVIEREHFALL